MKTGLTIQELAAKIKGNRELKRDYIVETPSTAMIIDEDRVPQLQFKEPDTPTPFAFPVLDTAHDQIAARLKIPSKYYRRMREETPDLLATNVNRWFREEPQKRMVRTLGGDVRAYLSNRYQRIENEEIAQVALPIIADIPEVKIVSCEITERRMYIQAVSPRVEGEVKRGDVVQAGVVVSNSEIGHGSVSVSPMIYRLVCLNGMISADGRFRAYHVGRAQENEDLWADDTKQADDRAVLLKVRDMVSAAVDKVQFSHRIEKMQGLTEIKVTGDPARAVEVLSQKVGASDGEGGGILRSLIEGGDLSAWGLVNAVTAQAHHARDYDRSVEIEAAGGTLLDLNPTEWKRILTAA